MSRRFEGRNAVITGASRGIGLAIARRLVEEGATVCVTARQRDTLDAAVAELGGSRHAVAVAGRADDPGHQAETIQRATEAFGPVDLLVNNAGINPVYGPLLDLDLAAARKTVEVNCLAAIAWVQQLYQAGLGERGGAVLNVASVAGVRPAPGIGFYGATKAMLAHITAELAVELGPAVRVNAVAPGIVKTRFAAALYDGREAEVARPFPLRRLGVPEDIGGVAAFLLSEDASWITGQVLIVDGGGTLAGGGT